MLIRKLPLIVSAACFLRLGRARPQTPIPQPGRQGAGSAQCVMHWSGATSTNSSA